MLGNDPAFCWGTQAPCIIPQFEPGYHPVHYTPGNKIYIKGALTLSNYGEIADTVQGVICVEGPPPPPPPPPPPTKRVFVTSTQYEGNLGGLSGADAKCQEGAIIGGLGGTWKAWLSDSSTNAKDRIVDAKYVRVFDNALIANNKADLLDGFLGNPITKDEFNGLTMGPVWTGTTSSGTVSDVGNPLVTHCLSWASNSGSEFGRRGFSSFNDSFWTHIGVTNCGWFMSLYCFEQ